MTGKLGVAIVGAGYGARVLAPAFAATPSWHIVGFAARSGERARRVAEEFGAKAYERAPDAFADDRVDAVAIALPPAVQGELLAVHAHQKHLFCEKPLSADLGTAEAIVERASEARRKVVVDFGFRNVPAFALARERIAAGDIGNPSEISIEWIMSSRSDPMLSFNWKSDLSQGGGTLNLMGSHALDYVRWMLGDVESIAVAENSYVPVRPGSSGLVTVTGADTCELAGELAAGAAFSARISTAAPRATGHTVVVRGDRGVLRVQNSPQDDYYCGFRLELRRTGTERWEQQPLPKVRCDRVGIARTFADLLARSIKTDTIPSPSLSDALAVQRCLHRARRSVGRESVARA